MLYQRTAPEGSLRRTSPFSTSRRITCSQCGQRASIAALTPNSGETPKASTAQRA